MTSSAPISSKKSSWQTLLTIDRNSDDFTHVARRILSEQRTRNFKASELTKEEALDLIELIEQTILKHPDIAPQLRSAAFTVLRRLCGTFRRLPRSYLINEDFKIKEGIPFAIGGRTKLWKRDWNGRKVAVKALRFGPDDDTSKTTKRFCKEVLLWKILNHPNILPFHGASMSRSQLCLVFPWLENGNVLSYTRKNPEVNRLRLLIDVASGLKFLHRPPQALLADFGMSKIIFDPFPFNRAVTNLTLPSLLALGDRTYQCSVSNDIYALGMVIYEVLTGTPPFARSEKAGVAREVGDERPQIPRDSEKLGFTDKVWEVLQKCWEKTPSSRPPVDLVSACLKQAAETWVVDVPAFVLATIAGTVQVINMNEDQARDFANKLDETLDEIGVSQYSGKTYLKHLQKLCGVSGVLPASFMLADGFDDIESRPLTSGGPMDVYRATYNGQPVVAKALKTTPVDVLENVHKRFAKEVVGRKWLRHKNILPFVGVASEPLPLSVVSAWMENGNIMSFIRVNPDQNPFDLLVGVVDGLRYLHQHDFVHGNLKGANILINSERFACLADFRLTATIEETTSVNGHSGYRAWGAIRWMAPEILNPERYGYVKRTRRKLPSKSTDIYALGMAILEVVTGRRPFEHTNPDAAVIQKVLSGIRPDRPSVGFSDTLWGMLARTWLEEFEASDSPSARPNTTDILELLRDEAETWPLALPSTMERMPNAASSADSYGFPDQLVGSSGKEPRDPPPRSPSVDTEKLQDVDNLIGLESTGGRPDNQDASTWFSQLTNEILDLTDQIASVALFGSIGVGKSFVARTVLDHGRTKAKFGDNRHFVRFDDLVSSLEDFIARLSGTIRTDTTQLHSHLQSSPPLILLLDSADSAIDSLDPEAKEIYATIEEIGGYEHVCLITTSRIYPNIHGFHRVEIPTPPEDCARDIFYSLCNLDRSPAVDTVITQLDFHPFSIELLARSTRENNWDEQMLLKAWDDQKGVLRTNYYQGLKDTIEPVFRSPKMKELGTMARDVLEAVASFQSGVREHQLEGIFHGTGGVREVVDVLCRFSLVCRRDGVLRMLSPLQFYFLKSMLVYAETEEVIRWGPDCMPAKAWLPVYTQGPPDDWPSCATSSDLTFYRGAYCAPTWPPCPSGLAHGPSGSGISHTAPDLGAPRRTKWMRRLPKVIRKRLLALFSRWTAPTILINVHEDPANTSHAVAQDLANTRPAAAQEDPADTSPAAAQEDLANIPPVIAQEDLINTPPVAAQEDPSSTPPAAAEEDLANMPPTDPQQQTSPTPVAYEMD